MTSGKRYFLISLALPILIPMTLMPFGLDNALSALLVFSLAFGGIPYLIMCAGIVVWVIKKSEKEIKQLSYFIPVIYVMVIAVFYFVWLIIKSETAFEAKEFLAVLSLLSIYGLTIGYVYVSLVNLVYEFTLSKYEDNEFTKKSSKNSDNSCNKS